MISRTGVHAIRALAALAELPPGKFTGAGRVAREIGAPRNYLGKLLQTLSRRGLLVSRRGLGGGVRLARPPERITLLDVLDPIEHLSRWSGCILGRKTCGGRTPCMLHKRWGPLREQYMNMLRATTLADLVRHGEIAKSGH